MQQQYKELTILYHDTTSVRGLCNHWLYMPCTYDRELVAKYGADELWRRWKMENPGLKPHSAVEMFWQRDSEGIWRLTKERIIYQEKTNEKRRG